MLQRSSSLLRSAPASRTLLPSILMCIALFFFSFQTTTPLSPIDRRRVSGQRCAVLRYAIYSEHVMMAECP
jgi:hypothetical protein